MISRALRRASGLVRTSHAMIATWTGTQIQVTTRNHLSKARSGASRERDGTPEIASSAGNSTKMTAIGTAASHPRL